MGRDVVVEVWGELVGEPEHGAWCGHCLLPSGAIIHMAAGAGDKVLTICRHFVCPGCGIQLHLATLKLDDLDGGPVELSWKERCVQGA